MFDEHTIRICEEYGFLSPRVDPLEAEYIELCNEAAQCRYLRRVCIRLGLSTALDIAMPYKGRTYFTLSGHPVVRRKKRRMRELRTYFKKQNNPIVNFNGSADIKIDPRTEHWFKRRVA